ncbi:hypothetical protein ACFQZX_03150 [Mucilaginibacter litoreus]|uniref:VWA domain-containing protein n=1 Tax=Mucilaginibacter litoreus TaxID=1048221 RepID=A0ABW3AP31_9SPHI
MSITWGSVSGWWALLCPVVGLLYAWLMYRQPVQLNKTLHYILFAVRAVVVTILALLLVSPLIKSTSYQAQKPLVLVAQDNSESIKLFKDSVSANSWTNALTSLQKQLGDKYEVQESHFDKTLHNNLDFSFSGKQTDISNALHQLNDRYINRNIGAVILATDGLYNVGADPSYEAKNFKSAIYTIALGDTVPRRDLLISNVNYNKTAFLGNDFIIEVLAEAYQSNGETMRLTVAEDGRQVYSQNITVNSSAYKEVIPIKLNADKKGVRRFTINVAPVKNELSVQNNTETIYVEVLDARQKVLLLYDAPHPDVSVIKQAIESNKNYEVKTSLTADAGTLKVNDYSAIILYQLSADGYNKVNPILQSSTPVWFIAGTQTDLQAFNNAQKLVRVSAGRTESQEVFAEPVPGFSAFTLSDSTKNKLAKMPPLMAAFGNYEINGDALVLLKQKIGNVSTAYPLLAFSGNTGKKAAVLTAEGLWRWQLAEYREYCNHHATEELLTQAIQYLTANANRQRFRVYASKNVFDEGEDILLNAELYNDALELINTPDVSIELKNTDSKKYSFVFSRNGNSYQLNAGPLPVDEYTYTASTTLGKQRFTANGRLTVTQLNLEAKQSAANHQLLRSIAQGSGGKMLYPSQAGHLAQLIRQNENVKTIEYEDKHYSDLIDLKWVFFALLLLLSTEWFLRKREGEV